MVYMVAHARWLTLGIRYIAKPLRLLLIGGSPVNDGRFYALKSLSIGVQTFRFAALQTSKAEALHS
jgi:hypothetical protein